MISNNYAAYAQKRYAEVNNLFAELGIEALDKTRPLSNPMLEEFYKTPMGKEARGMNLAALDDINKSGTFMSIFMDKPYATEPEDIELLSSKEAEMVKKWVRWVDPKSGKLFTVINKGDNPDGTRRVRVLNEEGEILKETDIVPKKIIVLDTFAHTILPYIENDKGSHGGCVQKILERNNPIADIETINLGNIKRNRLNAALDDLIERVERGEKIDVINCSFSKKFPSDLSQELSAKYNDKLSEEKVVSSYIYAKNIAEKDERFCTTYKKIKRLISLGVRVVCAAGNYGGNSFCDLATIDGVDVVGGLDLKGKMYINSASRAFTKHLELCHYIPRALEHGINITGKPGVDIPYENTIFKNLAGKKLEDCLASREDCLEFLGLFKDCVAGKISKEDYNKTCQKFEGKIFDNSQKKAISLCRSYIKQNLDSLDEIDINNITSIQDGRTDKINYSSVYSFGRNTNEYWVNEYNGIIIPYLFDIGGDIWGTSFAAPVRSAKITLNESMKEILEN